ncbi:hypothetical protein [Acetomicrobium sp.]|jgi:hypothetical protein|uniref:hypothetical protein n=1 Tax=Acetomicrobium sp. TaxID=1872099 RepID=UPI002C04F313|nr:hypothetical protein [Acetomicrobium sp.]
MTRVQGCMIAQRIQADGSELRVIYYVSDAWIKHMIYQLYQIRNVGFVIAERADGQKES